MKVKKVHKSEIVFIETDEEGWNSYMRLGNNNWFLNMGESWEPYYSTVIEELYEEYYAAERISSTNK